MSLHWEWAFKTVGSDPFSATPCEYQQKYREKGGFYSVYVFMTCGAYEILFILNFSLEKSINPVDDMDNRHVYYTYNQMY